MDPIIPLDDYFYNYGENNIIFYNENYIISVYSNKQEDNTQLPLAMISLSNIIIMENFIPIVLNCKTRNAIQIYKFFKSIAETIANVVNTNIEIYNMVYYNIYEALQLLNKNIFLLKEMKERIVKYMTELDEVIDEPYIALDIFLFNSYKDTKNDCEMLYEFIDTLLHRYLCSSIETNSIDEIN